MNAATARKPTTAAPVSLTLPKLAKGEAYAGILLQEGKPVHHLVLLPGDTKLNWKDAGAWAKKQGGELPTRKEQALLFANAAEAFKRDWYWSSEQYAGDESSAWYQYFGLGNQNVNHKTNQLRARSVRRIQLSNSVL